MSDILENDLDIRQGSGSSFINRAYKVYPKMSARQIYKRLTWRENILTSLQTLDHAYAHLLVVEIIASSKVIRLFRDIMKSL